MSSKLSSAVTILSLSVAAAWTPVHAGMPFPGPLYNVPDDPVLNVLADFNGDGRPDLATSAGDTRSVYILDGTQGGGLAPARTRDVQATVTGLLTADFNRDGKPDLAVCGDLTGSTAGFQVLLGKGDGSFQDLPAVRAGSSGDGCTAADFDGDAIPDLAMADLVSGA